MKHSIQVGISFGSTSGVITALGLISGLYFGTESRTTLIAGIITIAIADSLSDALGIHISEESENIHTTKDIWISTVSTFLTKFIISSSFLIPLFIFPLSSAVPLSIIWGTFLLAIFSFYLARSQSKNCIPVILEHLSIAYLVIFLAAGSGYAINTYLTL